MDTGLRFWGWTRIWGWIWRYADLSPHNAMRPSRKPRVHERGGVKKFLTKFLQASIRAISTLYPCEVASQCPNHFIGLLIEPAGLSGLAGIPPFSWHRFCPPKWLALDDLILQVVHRFFNRPRHLSDAAKGRGLGVGPVRHTGVADGLPTPPVGAALGGLRRTRYTTHRRSPFHSITSVRGSSVGNV